MVLAGRNNMHIQPPNDEPRRHVMNEAPEENELTPRELAEEEDDEAAEDIDDDTSDLDVLVALAELDAEAAQAYRIAASGVDDPLTRTKLDEFAEDHLRHVATINRLL